MAVDLTDPVSSANASVVSSNIKNFGHSPDLMLTTLMSDMIESQRSMSKINLAVVARATRMILDDSSDNVQDVMLGQVSAKGAMTTPPDTSGQLASLAAQVAALTQMLSSTFANSPVTGTQATK